MGITKGTGRTLKGTGSGKRTEVFVPPFTGRRANLKVVKASALQRAAVAAGIQVDKDAGRFLALVLNVVGGRLALRAANVGKNKQVNAEYLRGVVDAYNIGARTVFLHPPSKKRSAKKKPKTEEDGEQAEA